MFDSTISKSHSLVNTDFAVHSAFGLLTASKEVASVQIVLKDRPRYADLVRYRIEAEAAGVSMIVLGSGGLILRRAPTSDGVKIIRDTRLANRAPALIAKTKWITELASMSEGTR